MSNNAVRNEGEKWRRGMRDVTEEEDEGDGDGEVGGAGVTSSRKQSCHYFPYRQVSPLHVSAEEGHPADVCLHPSDVN